MSPFKKVSRTACPYCGQQTVHVLAKKIDLLEFAFEDDDQRFRNKEYSLELASKCMNPNCKHAKDIAADVSVIDGSITFVPTDNGFIERVHNPLKEYTINIKNRLSLPKPPDNSFDTGAVIRNSEFVKHE